MLSASVTLVLGTGLVLSYMQARPDEQHSDPTLANIEALAFKPDETQDGTSVPCIYTGDEYDYCIYTIVTTDGSAKVTMLQFCVNYWC